jgi:hypothetical protein
MDDVAGIALAQLGPQRPGAGQRTRNSPASGASSGQQGGDELIGEPVLIVLGRPSPIAHEGEVGLFVGERPDDVGRAALSATPALLTSMSRDSTLSTAAWVCTALVTSRVRGVTRRSEWANGSRVPA